MQESQTFFKQDTSEWEFAAEGITRQLVAFNSDLMLVRVKFEKGAIANLHHHIHSQGAYIVSGKFIVTIDSESQTLEAGDGFYVSPNQVHGAECIEAGILIDCFSPVRADFLTD